MNATTHEDAASILTIREGIAIIDGRMFALPAENRAAFRAASLWLATRMERIEATGPEAYSYGTNALAPTLDPAALAEIQAGWRLLSEIADGTILGRALYRGSLRHRMHEVCDRFRIFADESKTLRHCATMLREIAAEIA